MIAVFISVIRFACILFPMLVVLREGGRVSAPMHGKVIEILVAPGDAVHKGQRLAVIEAMKMEHALIAPIDGTVADVRVSAGSQVADGALVLTIEPASEPASTSS